jgi:hypothetical protein
VRKSRHRPQTKVSVENTTPNVCRLPASILPVSGTAPIGVDTAEIITPRKRSSAELAAVAMLSDNYLKKRRTQTKHSDDTPSTVNSRHESNVNNSHASMVTINDELLKLLSQGKHTRENVNHDRHVFVRSFRCVRFQLRRSTNWPPMDRKKDTFTADEFAALALVVETENQSL